MIYTIKNGDTLFKIANNFGTTIDKLVVANGLTMPNKLEVGQNLWIPVEDSGSGTYTVVRGDTMYMIARRYGISLEDLINANPQVANPNLINIGQVINIPSSKPQMEVNGYAIANISENTLDRILPYLTYLSIFSYQVKPDGSMFGLFEQNVINDVLAQSVYPMMVITNIAEGGGFDSDIAHAVLTNNAVQTTLINNIERVISEKNYAGVNVDFEYIYPEDKNAYTEFLRNLKSAIGTKLLTVAVAPKYRDNQSGILYEAHDYRAIGEIADRVIIMTYEWGYMYGEPMAISPYSEVEAVISYAVSRIPSTKILMGLPNYAYDWTLPWQQGNSATAMSLNRALELAINNRSQIMWDEKAKSPYFNYTDASGVQHVVWFEDARSIFEKLGLVTKYNLAGISIWTINNYNSQLWSVVSGVVNVKKFANS